MTRLGVRAAVVDGALVEGDVELSGNRVARVGVRAPADRAGLVALPGLVDLQVNGFAGVDLLAADEAGWRTVATELARHGTTAFLAALITADPAETTRALQVAAAAVQWPVGPAARVLGAHLEGPFLSHERAGTHPVGLLRDPDVDLVHRWLSVGPVRVVTLAPELVGALPAVRALVDAGVVVSLGHSACDARTAHAAVDAGARLVTHVFNAMSSPTSREPGLAGVALVREDVTVCAIADGVHLADEVLALVRTCCADRLVLVSDVTSAAGMGDGRFRLGDVDLEVSHGVVRRTDGVLAGSARPLSGALPVVRRAGWSWPEVAEATSGRPGRLLLGEGAPRLRPGDRADVVLVDDEGALQRVYCEGVCLGQ